MIINRASLATLNIAFNAAFTEGLTGVAASQWARIATRVPSTTSSEEYGWLGKVPNVREWIGDRQIQNIASSSYRIKNRDFELTIGVERNDIQDDNLGLYNPLFRSMGESTGVAYDLMLWALLKAGFSTECYDGQYFFDTDHPVLAADGTMTTVANTDGGSGEPWFLLDNRRSIKPLILQVRKDWEFVPKDKLDDENVFQRKQFVYGVDGRYNAGYGFWQFIWGSKQPLDSTAYSNARAALMGMKGDLGRPLGNIPNLFICGPALESKARKILTAETDAAGATNVFKGTAELLVVPWLA